MKGELNLNKKRKKEAEKIEKIKCLLLSAYDDVQEINYGWNWKGFKIYRKFIELPPRWLSMHPNNVFFYYQEQLKKDK